MFLLFLPASARYLQPGRFSIFSESSLFKNLGCNILKAIAFAGMKVCDVDCYFAALVAPT